MGLTKNIITFDATGKILSCMRLTNPRILPTKGTLYIEVDDEMWQKVNSKTNYFSIRQKEVIEKNNQEKEDVNRVERERSTKNSLVETLGKIEKRVADLERKKP